METPSPQDARRALDQLSEDASAVRYPPLPRWFFPVQAALMAGICLAQLLPSPGSSLVTVALGGTAGLLGWRHWLNRDGVAGVSMSFRDMAPFLVGVYGTLAVCWVLSGTTDARWIWSVGAVVVAGIVLGTGRRYRKTYGDAF